MTFRMTGSKRPLTSAWTAAKQHESTPPMWRGDALPRPPRGGGPPSAALRLAGGGAGRAAVTLAVVAVGAAVAGAAFRWRAAGVTLESVDRHEHRGLSPRRQGAGGGIAV